MKKLWALVAVTLAVSGLAGVPNARAAGRLCPEKCYLEGAVEGTGIIPDPNQLMLSLPFVGIDLRDDIPAVRLGVVNLSATLAPVRAVAPPPQVTVRSGRGTLTVVDDILASPDRGYEVHVTRSGTVDAGKITVIAAGARSNLLAGDVSMLRMNLSYTRAAGVTTFAGTFGEQYNGTAPIAPAPLETVTVDAGDIDGTTSTAVLEAGATYKLTASGVIDYDRIRPGNQVADAECTFDDQGNYTLERASAEVPRWQPQRYFTVANPEDAARTDFFDPDPTDDPVDLYVDGRALDWVPNDPGRATRTACNEDDHTYVALFTPPTTRPVALGLFDLQYNDNGCSTAGCGFGSLKVTIERASDTPFPGADGPRVDSLLLHANDPDGQASRPLEAGRSYAVVTRGMYKYQGNFPQAFYADAECVRQGNADNGLYRAHRFDGAGGITDPLDVYLNGAAVDWEPLGKDSSRAALEPAQCSPMHAYRTTVTGTGSPLQLLVKDTSLTAYNDDSGTLRVEIFELS